MTELVRLKTTTQGSQPSAFGSRFNIKLGCVQKYLKNMEASIPSEESISNLLEPLLKLQKEGFSTPVVTDTVPLRKKLTFDESLNNKPIGDMKVVKKSKISKPGFSKSKTHVSSTTQLCNEMMEATTQQSARRMKTEKVSRIPKPKVSKLKTPTKVVEQTNFGFSRKEMGSNLVTFSPGKLDSCLDAPVELDKESWSQPGSSTCAYSDYFAEDIIVEDPEEDSL